MVFTGKLLLSLQSKLSDRLQKVVHNVSSWKQVLAGVPQGSILGPAFFLIFINELPTNIKSQVRIFADDTSRFSVVNKPQICARKLNMTWEDSLNGNVSGKCILTLALQGK